MPCPYLDGRVERNLFTELRGAQAQDLHDQLALAGFRRSHHIVYRPACPGCNGCVPIRVPVEDSVVDTELMSIRDASGALVGACLTDVLSSGLSAVYSYFEPSEDRRSLGTFSILHLVREAAARGRPHVYLGYWIEGCAKMTYKSRFQPVEHLGTKGWTDAALPSREPPG